MEAKRPIDISTEEANDVIRRLNDLGGVTSIISTQRIMVGKMSDYMRRLTLLCEIIIAIIGSLAGLTGAIIAPLKIELPPSLLPIFFILSGLASTGAVAVPKFVDFMKKFSGRKFRETIQDGIKSEKSWEIHHCQH